MSEQAPAAGPPPGSLPPPPPEWRRPAYWPHEVVEAPLPPDLAERMRAAATLASAEPETAVGLVQAVVALARERDDGDALASALCQAAGVMQRALRPDLAFSLSLEAQPLLEQRDDVWRATNMVLLRARACAAVREHERALELAAEAAARFERVADQVGRVRCLNAMAQVQMAREAFGDAAGLYAQARALLTPGHGPRIALQLGNNEAYARLMLAQSLGRQGLDPGAELDAALALLPPLAAIEASTGEATQSNMLDTIVGVHLARGDLAQALPAALALVRWARRFSRATDRALVWGRLSDLHAAQGRAEAARACAARAVQFLRRHPQHPELVAACNRLERLLEAAGEHAACYRLAREAEAFAEAQRQRAVAMRAEMLALDLRVESELRAAEQTLGYAQRMSNLGYLVASVSHELNQPMASIRLLAETAQALLERGDRAGMRDSLDEMLRLAEHLAGLSSQLAALPLPSTAEPPRAALGAAVDDALLSLRSRMAAVPCRLERQPCTAWVQAPRSQLVQVISNLLNNALDALEGRPDGRITLHATAGADSVSLVVSDSGPGLSPEVMERLFTPFFSTKTAGRGLGLGLSLSRDVVLGLGGRLLARNGAAGGAEFELVLPRAADA